MYSKPSMWLHVGEKQGSDAALTRVQDPLKQVFAWAKDRLSGVGPFRNNRWGWQQLEEGSLFSHDVCEMSQESSIQI